MSEGTSVNTGVARWPDPDSAYLAVRRMQIKLHRWAGEDTSRRFGDLFNLVYDPAFLVHAWERVASNQGARTAGIDKVTVAHIETWIGVEAFLGQIRDTSVAPGSTDRVLHSAETDSSALAVPVRSIEAIAADGLHSGTATPPTSRTPCAASQRR